MPTINGWKNHATWNVALYLQNEWELYQLCLQYRQRTYSALVRKLAARGIFRTPDGVAYRSRQVCRRELTEMLRTL